MRCFWRAKSLPSYQGTMEKLVERMLIRLAGVGSFDVEELGAADKALRNGRIACGQEPYQPPHGRQGKCGRRWLEIERWNADMS
jgi:hypothetical protein